MYIYFSRGLVGFLPDLLSFWASCLLILFLFKFLGLCILEINHRLFNLKILGNKIYVYEGQGRKVGPSRRNRDPRNTQHLRSPWDPQTSLALQEPWDIPSNVRTFEPTQKYPESLKLKHKQKTSLNYITEQTKTKAENCVYLSEVSFFYGVVNNDY